MRSLLLCLCLLCLSVLSLPAQDLSMNTLLKLRQLQTPEAVHKRLAGKGWKMMAKRPPTDEKIGFASWAYKPVDGKATAWLYVYFHRDGSSFNIIEFDPDCNCALSKFEKNIRQRRMLKLDEGEHREGISGFTPTSATMTGNW